MLREHLYTNRTARREDLHEEILSPENEWQYLGVTPIEKVRFPVGNFRWRMEKEGYETVLAVSTTFTLSQAKERWFAPYDIKRVLDKKGSLPSGMVRVAGAQIEDYGNFSDFFIDRYEVTNKQFKEFVDKGGYQKKEYWKHSFINDGKNLIWEEAMAGFVDQSGRPGPAAWLAGSYPEGQENYPVSGVSWYEAAAYADFVGKSLPTGYHWGMARGGYTPLFQIPDSYALFFPLCNYQGKGPAPVGSYQNMTPY